MTARRCASRRGRHRRRTRGPGRWRDDRGSTTVEFVICAAAMVLLLMAVVQVGLWFHCRSVATTAARHGVDEVRVLDGSAAAGIAAATAFLDQAGSSLHDRGVDASRGATTSSVTVTGNVVSVIPGVSWSVSATVDAPTEQIEP